MNIAAPNDPWSLFWSLGYRRLVPIAPPGAALSANAGIRPESLGKIPGVRSGETWTGLAGWSTRTTTLEDCERWRDMGAGVGVACGRGLLAIDADTLSEDLAAIAREEVERLGPLPTRIGQAPKALFLCRCPPEWRRPKILFGVNGHGGQIDFRTYGQFVAWGTHPATRAPYRWTRPIQAFDDLPALSAGALDALAQRLLERLPAAREARARTGDQPTNVGPAPNQELLRGEPRWVSAAIAALPNDYVDRADYLDVLYALKAATAPDEQLGLELALDWAARWTLGDNDPAVVERDYRSLSGPFRLGADWLFDMAEIRARELCERSEAGNGCAAFSRAAMWHETELEPAPTIAAESLFGEPPSDLTPIEAIRATPFDFAAANAVGPREMLYGGHYARQFLSSTIAPSKVGKTSLIICEALAMASGKPLLCVAPIGPLRVWIWNGEDPVEELQRRIVACMRLYGLTAEDIGDRLFVDSGRRTPIVLAKQTRDGAAISEPVERAVTNAILENRIDVFQVDPFISSHRVSENDNNAIDVVAKRWGRIADATHSAIEIVHHSRKLNGAEVSVEDGRGASALLATVRSSRALARMTETEAVRLGLTAIARRLFRFTEVSSNLSIPAPESQQWLELTSVSLNNGSGEDAVLSGDSVGVARVFNADAARRDAVAAATGGEGGDGERRAFALIRAGMWRDSPQADDWVGVPIARALGVDRNDPTSAGRLKAIVADWLRSGKLIEVQARNRARQIKTYVQVAAGFEESVAIEPDDLFG